MVAKLTKLTHKIAILLHLVAESYTICSCHSRWPVQKVLDTPLYVNHLLMEAQYVGNVFLMASAVSLS